MFPATMLERKVSHSDNNTHSCYEMEVLLRRDLQFFYFGVRRYRARISILLYLVKAPIAHVTCHHRYLKLTSHLSDVEDGE